ncbi:MAG: WG repeat-containing protein [Muribaculaceae bacterium]|nr:WG repeat-containing protein [Muribaculaceae bacterium]
MKKKITFSMWLSIFFGGIWQFIRNIFSWKNKTPFWRVIWAAITICILAFTCMMGYAFYDEFMRHRSWNYEARYDPKLSKDYRFRNNGYNLGKSFIYDAHTKKKVLKGIDWIARPLDGDSLIVVAKNRKRGYVNRFTGKTQIPFKYDAAWVFTDGVAGVCEGDSVYFIDHSGKPIYKKKFARTNGYNNYVYHGEYAAIPENGKYGLVDRSGNWAYKPDYTYIETAPKNMWFVGKDGKNGAIGADGKTVVPCEYEHVAIYPEGGITVGLEDHSRKRLDYEGNVVDDFVFDEVYFISYYSDEFDKDGNRKEIAADMHKYSVDNYYGLMTKTGIPVTPPLYSEIEAVAPNVYQCQIPNTYKCIMINGKGEKIND